MDVEWALDCIEKGLFETRSLKRNSIKIRICAVLAKPSDYDCKPLVINVLRIVHWLQIRVVEDFMLVLELHTDVLDELTDFAGNVLVRRTENTLVISNANCKICGYQEKWMMSLS